MVEPLLRGMVPISDFVAIGVQTTRFHTRIAT